MIYDVNPLSLSRFVNEAESIPGAKGEVAKNPKDLAEKAVCSPSSLEIIDISPFLVELLRACQFDVSRCFLQVE